MKENKYDDETFFAKYRNFPRSVYGLNAAGEWPELQKMLPDFNGKRVLDLGCGFGWHCIYAAQHGAKSVLGIDLSEKMLSIACQKTTFANVEYRRQAIEDATFEAGSFDIVISSLALHYIEDFDTLCQKIAGWLVPGGRLIFSAEHPVFTAFGTEDWVYDEKGNKLYWPVDRYFSPGYRQTSFLGEEVVKYHRTLTAYLNTLLKYGLQITAVVEPEPPLQLLNSAEGMKDELRRPMMLLVSAQKGKIAAK